MKKVLSLVLALALVYFNKNGSNGKAIAGFCRISRDVPCDLLIRQVRSPMSRLSRDDILLQNRAGKGMPYVMAILDDTVTTVTPVPAAVPDDDPTNTEESNNT